jgi:hypothetical protein
MTKRKAGKLKPIYDGIEFDSSAEVEFYIFLKDLKKYKLIKEFQYQPPTYTLIPKATEIQTVQLKTKTKRVEKTLYRAHEYTADFLIKVKPEVFNRIDPKHLLKINKNNTILIDIKGSYNDFGGDRIYKIHEKMMYFFFKLHLNKVVPEEYFKAIRIAPNEIRWMKNRKTPTLRKPYINTQSVEEFCKQVKQPETKTINIPGLPCL